MAEKLIISKGGKEEQYQSIIAQLKALVKGEPDEVANLANICAVLKEQSKWLWVGFYIVKDNELVLGPFQGPIACTRIQKGEGVCGSAWKKSSTVIVDDVAKFPGHIACSSLSKSEIVVPVIRHGKVLAVLDVDSKALAQYDKTDKKYLEEIAHLVAGFM